MEPWPAEVIGDSMIVLGVGVCVVAGLLYWRSRLTSRRCYLRNGSTVRLAHRELDQLIETHPPIVAELFEMNRGLKDWYENGPSSFWLIRPLLLLRRIPIRVTLRR